MDREKLNASPLAASAMVKILDETIAELERQLEIHRDALAACRVVAAEPELLMDYRPPVSAGRDALKEAMAAVDAIEDANKKLNGSKKDPAAKAA